MTARADGTESEPGGVTFIGTDDDAYRFIAAVSWPFEREENRDRWAVTMRDRPDLLATEIKRARAMLDAVTNRVFRPAKTGSG